MLDSFKNSNRLLSNSEDTVVTEAINYFVISYEGTIISAIILCACIISSCYLIKQMKWVMTFICFATSLFINVLFTITDPRDWDMQNDMSNLVISLSILTLGTLQAVFNQFFYNKLSIFIIGFNVARAIFLQVSNIVNIIQLLSTKNLNDGNGYRINGIWNPYEKSHIMYVIFYYTWAILGGIFAILIINVGIRPQNLVKQSKVLVCIQIVSNFTLIFSESIQILLYRVLLIPYFRESLTFYYASLVDSCCFVITYTVVFIVTYLLVYHKQNNWNRTSYDIEPIKNLIISQLEGKLNNLNASIELNTTISSKDFRESMVIDNYENTSSFNTNFNTLSKNYDSKQPIVQSNYDSYNQNNIFIDFCLPKEEDQIRRQKMSDQSLSYGISVKDIYRSFLTLAGNECVFDSVDNFNPIQQQNSNNLQQSKASIDGTLMNSEIIEESNQEEN